MSENEIARDNPDELDSIIAEYIAAVERDGPQDRNEWLRRHPDLAVELEAYFDDHDQVMQWVDPLSSTKSRQLPATESFCPTPARASPWSDDDIKSGDVLAGQFRILDVKQGGMGRVYFVTGIGNRDDVPKGVMKTVIPFRQWRAARRHRNDAESSLTARYTALLLRFRREAMNWVRLSEHPNIVRAWNVNEVAGRPYLFLDYADSGDLADWIRSGRLTVPVAVDFALQFCRGMAFAKKAAGLIHRDIKPSNVLVHQGSQVKITDLGLARAFADDETANPGEGSQGQDDLSRPGGGTRAYMAPEQFVSLHDADTGSDVFSFGAMLFEMLTCRRLFDEVDPFNASIRRLRLPKAHEVNRSVPESLSAVVARCVAYDREARYRSFKHVAKDILDTGLSKRWKMKRPQPAGNTAPAKSRQDWHREVYSLDSLGQYDEAEKLAQQAIDADPNYHGHWLNRGKALAELGRFDEAHRCYARAAELGPDDVQCWFNLAYVLLSLRRPAEAWQAAQRALSLDANCSEGWDASALCQCELRGLRAALHYFRRAIDANPHNWRALANLGRCLMELGEDDDALSFFRKSVAVNPTAEKSWFNIAIILGQQGRHAECLDAVGRCLELNRTNAAAWVMRGTVLSQTDVSPESLKDAADCLRRAIAIDPSQALSATLLRQVETQLSLQSRRPTRS